MCGTSSGAGDKEFLDSTRIDGRPFTQAERSIAAFRPGDRNLFFRRITAEERITAARASGEIDRSGNARKAPAKNVSKANSAPAPGRGSGTATGVSGGNALSNTKKQAGGSKGAQASPLSGGDSKEISNKTLLGG